MDNTLFLEKLDQYADWIYQDSAYIKVKKLKHTPLECHSCGNICLSGRTVESRYYITDYIGHWRHRCQECNLCFNPYTKQFDLSPGQQGHYWIRYMKLSHKSFDPAVTKLSTIFNKD